MRRLSYPILAFIFLLNVYLKNVSSFGIDIERYSIILEQGVNDWSLYYLKEFLSWGVFDLLSKFSEILTIPSQLLVLDAMLLAVLIVGCAGSGFSAAKFVYFYASFAFILLSFNVLRQYIAVIFLAVAIVSAAHMWRSRFIFAAIMAVASHNGSLLLVLPLILIFIRDLRLSLRLLSIAMVIVVLVIVAGTGIAEIIFIGGDETLDEPYWKVLSYLFLSIYLFFIFKIKVAEKHRTTGILHSIDVNAVYINASILAFGCVMSFMPFPNWIINRNWLSIVALQAFLFLCFRVSEKNSVNSLGLFVIGYLIPMALLIGLHPGASEMAFGT